MLALDGNGGDVIVVWSSLERWEHSLVDSINVLLLAENDSTTSTAHGLMCGSCDNICVLEWVGENLRGDKTGEMGHVDQEKSSYLVAYLTETWVVDVTWVGRCTSDDHLGHECASNVLEFIIVDDTGFGVDSVWE